MSTQTADGAQFDAELKKTELGNVIVENKGLFGALIALIFAGAIGFGFYQKSLEAKNEEASKAFYEFSSTQLDKFANKEIKPEALVSAFNTKMSSYASSPVYFGASLTVFDAMKDNDELALSVIENLNGSNTYQIYALAIRKAAAYESLKNYNEAIASLNLINSENFKAIEGKVNLDLGRLHLLNNNKAQAKTHFEAVIKTNTQAEFKSLASYYLTQLN